MKISLNYLSKYLDFEIDDTKQLASLIGLQLGALEEEPMHLAKSYQGILAVRVIEVNKLGGSDHLKVCLIDDAQKYSEFNSLRNKSGMIQVVCGAPNVRKGMITAWIPPGSIVPSTYLSTKLVLESRRMLNTVSNGMLASPKELNISDNHTGIIELENYVIEGSTLIEVLELDDVIYDIENKMFTHRPDCFGVLGIAREISAIYGKKFKSPKWYLDENFKHSIAGSKKYHLMLENKVPDIVRRFSAIIVEDIEVKSSPLLVQSYLSRMGINPINNVVDATNLTMLETAQPLHAYDLAKLRIANSDKLNLSVRTARNKESLKLLDNKVYLLGSNDLVIDFNNKAVGLAGIMGGYSSQIDQSTTSVLIESACFDMYSIRKSSMQHGLFSEAVTRFTKGQSPFQTRRALLRCVDLVDNYNPNNIRIASSVEDINLIPASNQKINNISGMIKVELKQINSLLGTKLSIKQVSELLINCEFKVKTKNNRLIVFAPFWRTDIESNEDIIEEIGRLYGYQNIKPLTMQTSVHLTNKNKVLELSSKIRHILRNFGANETLNYSFVSEKLLKSNYLSSDDAFELQNPVSPELSFYRTSLMPSLIKNIHPNIKLGYKEFAIFEIGTYHHNKYIDKDSVIEFKTLALAYASDNRDSMSPYFKARYFLDNLIDSLNIEKLNYASIRENKIKIDPYIRTLLKPFQESRTAVISYDNHSIIGFAGEFKDSVAREFKLPKSVSGFELDLGRLGNIPQKQTYHLISKYPTIKQDITLETIKTNNYSSVHDSINNFLSNNLKKTTEYRIQLISVYNKDLKDHIRYSFRIFLTDFEKTLTDSEINELFNKLVTDINSKIKIKRI